MTIRGVSSLLCLGLLAVGCQGHFRCGTESPSDEVKEEVNRALAEWKEGRQRTRQRQLLGIPNWFRQWSSGGGGDSNGQNSQAGAGRNKYAIPTYFHVIQESAKVGAVSDKQIERGYMVGLNRAFEDTPFTFELKGVNRAVNPNLYYCDTKNGIRKIQRRYYVEGTDVLNVYVCDPITKAAKGKAAAGLSSFPFESFGELGTLKDGVVVINPGASIPDLAYSTLLHEVRENL